MNLEREVLGLFIGLMIFELALILVIWRMFYL